MTMPHMMNCSHSDTGWCLDCVRELVDEQSRETDTLSELLSSIEAFEEGADPGVGREVQSVSVRLYCDGSGDMTVGIAATEDEPGTRAMLNRVFHTEALYGFDTLGELFAMLKNFDTLRPSHPEAK